MLKSSTCLYWKLSFRSTALSNRPASLLSLKTQSVHSEKQLCFKLELLQCKSDGNHGVVDWEGERHQHYGSLLNEHKVTWCKNYEEKIFICLFSLYLYIATKIIDSSGTNAFSLHFFLSLLWILFRPFWLSSKQKSGRQTAVMMSLYGMDSVHSSIKMQRTVALSIAEFITCCSVDDVLRHSSSATAVVNVTIKLAARAFKADERTFTDVRLKHQIEPIKFIIDT